MTDSQTACGFAQSDEMALNHVDKDWIRSTIQESIREHYKGKMARFRDWLPAGAAVAVVLFSLTQWNAFTVFRVRTEDRLAIIEGRALKAEAVNSPSAVLRTIGKLAPREFSASLPALRTVAEQRSSDVKPVPALLYEVTTKLRNSPQASPEYWPTVLQFIQFASSGLSEDVPPPGSLGAHLGNIISGSAHGMLFSHQVVFLDSGPIVGLRFENCRIIFGPSFIQMGNVVFINCVFEFQHLDQPTPYLVQVARQFLSTDFKNVVISTA